MQQRFSSSGLSLLDMPLSTRREHSTGALLSMHPTSGYPGRKRRRILVKAHTKTVGPAVHFVSRRSPWHMLTGCVLLFCATDADFLAFKQQVEGDPELLPSAEVQLDLKEQARKALAGQVASNSHQHTMSCQPCTVAMIGTSHHSICWPKQTKTASTSPSS